MEKDQIYKRTRRGRLVLIALVAFIAVVLAITALTYFRTEERLIQVDKHAQLAAIADLKINQITAWRQERLVDARLNAGDAFTNAVITQWLSHPEDKALKDSLLEHMRSIRDVSQYQNIMLAAADGSLLLTADAGLRGLDADTQALARRVVISNMAFFGEFSRDSQSSQVFLDVAAPILDEHSQAVAALILRSDPAVFLYPLIQSWPMPSASAETLLVRRDGDYALYLNTLRHRAEAPLTLRLPLTSRGRPGVEAVLGRKGIYEGFDYLGSPVLADLRPVPGTAWFLVAKIDKAELFSEVIYHGKVTLILGGLVILMTASLGAFLYSYRQSYFFQRMFLSESERRQANEEIRATLYGIGDGVISTDAQGRVTRLNPVAETLTGWLEAEALGQPLERVFNIISEDTRDLVANPVERVLREGKVVGLANHTLLIARDCSEHVIADSAAPIRGEDQELSGVVLVFRDQEKERATQKALQASQQKFLTIFQTSPDAILVTRLPEGRIVDVNLAAERVLGYVREELLGRTTVEMGLWVSLEERQAFIERSQSEQPLHNFEISVHTRTGRQIAALISGDFLRFDDGEYYLSVIHDISERKKAEVEARERETLLRALIDNAPFEIWARDNHEICVLENPARIRRIGSRLGERPQDAGLPPDELRMWLDINQIAYDGNLVDQEVCYKIEGQEHYFNLIVAPIFDGKVVRGIVGFNIDVNERKMAEKALMLEREELARSNAELEQFAYVASHDLQEPLRMVSSYMQLIEKRYKGRLDQDADEFIGYAVDGAVRMQRLINDLLMYSRVGTRGKPFAEVASETALAQALQNLQASITEQRAEVRHDLLPVVMADASQLVQLFQNLISNAIKFHGEQVPRVHISARAVDGEWLFALSDNGIGIDAQYAERIFVLFQRLHERSAYPGTGIGLAICKKIVQRHGGRIWVESQPGQGATFYFTIPESGQ